MGSERAIVVLGAGAGGLLTGITLANRGHRVTVLERDTEPPPTSDAASWDSWNRRGVTQFRQPHGLLTRGRQVIAQEAPDVAAAVDACAPFVVGLPAPDSDSLDDEDRLLGARIIRRATLERLLADAADRHPRLEVLRGVAATGPLTATGTPDGRPRIIGVHTDTRGEVLGELVVDSLGRRSSAGDWVESLGCPVERSSESDGFTYFSRWFHVDDFGDEPITSAFGGVAPGLLSIVFPGDGGYVGVAMVGLAGDRLLRRLNDPDRFMSVARHFPLLERWLDPATSTPVTDIVPMGSIQNRHLRLRTDGRPGPVGLISTGDSGVSTNPSLGRGISVAADLAVELGDLLDDGDDATELVDAWDEVHLRRHRPWLTDAIDSDADLRCAFAAMTEQRPPAPPANPDRSTLQRAASVDPICWRRWMRAQHVVDTPTSCWDDAELMERARDVEVEGGPPPLAMDRSRLDELLTA